MDETNAIVVREEQPLTRKEHEDLLGVEIGLIRQQVDKINTIVATVLVRKTHYDNIPGCDKPSLLKPGAEKLCMVFELVASYKGQDIPKELPNGHREYHITCELRHKRTGMLWASACAACSTMESKYRWRNPPAKITNEKVPKEYWDCRKSDPAKAKSLLGGPNRHPVKGEDDGWYIAIRDKKERIENPDIADCYNTVLKMAIKRAYVAATLNATGCSDMFVHDMEDFEQEESSQEVRAKGQLVDASLPPQFIYHPASPALTNTAAPNVPQTFTAASDLAGEIIDVSGCPAPQCPQCGKGMKRIPAGTTKHGPKKGQPYGAFWVCVTKPETGCKGSVNESTHIKQYKERMRSALIPVEYATGTDPDPLETIDGYSGEPISDDDIPF